MICPLCASSAVVPAHQLDGAHTVLRCRSCSGAFLSPAPDERARQALYDGDYYRRWGASGDDPALRAMKRRTADRCLRAILRYRSTGVLLDIGCAAGDFLVAAREAGFTARGVELSGEGAARARAAVGAACVTQARVEDIAVADASCDVVTMIDVLEHLADPVSVLRTVRRLLKPGGIAMVVTPDTGSLTHRLMGRRWTHYKQEHLFYFNEQALTLLARKTGFIVRAYGPATKYLTAAYVRAQYAAYPHPVLTPAVSALCRFLPRAAREMSVPLFMGESAAILS